MPRPTTGAAPKPYRLTPEAIAAIRQLRQGAESDAAVICRVLTTVAGTNPDLGIERPVEIPGQTSLIDIGTYSEPALTVVGEPPREVSPNHPSARGGEL